MTDLSSRDLRATDRTVGTHLTAGGRTELAAAAGKAGLGASSTLIRPRETQVARHLQHSITNMNPSTEQLASKRNRTCPDAACEDPGEHWRQMRPDVSFMKVPDHIERL